MDLLLGYWLCFFFFLLSEREHLKCVGNDWAAKKPRAFLDSFFFFFCFTRPLVKKAQDGRMEEAAVVEIKGSARSHGERGWA